VRSSAQTVNGLTARLIEFDLQSQNGTIHGLVQYVEYGGAVYEIAGYATSAAWAGYTSTVQQALGSFRALTDARYLDVAPDRIRIIRLPSAMTFTQFTQRYPSTVSVDEVRLANQADADATLPAGRLMKQITGGHVPTR
jgi:predicted Zn-dependent protease